MDQQTQLLIASVIINVLMIIERFMKRITKSKCCGSELTLDRSDSSYTPPKLVTPTDIELKTVKIETDSKN